MNKDEIEDESNFCSGWDWFACDAEGRIGHFDNGGLRHLPRTVKGDRQLTERLEEYFLEEAPDRCGYRVHDVQDDVNEWKRVLDREEYLKKFGGIARKGVFSHDTQNIRGREEAEAAKRLGVFSAETQHIYDINGSASYYLVTLPEQPLHLYDLPVEIAEMVARVRSPFPFGTTTHFKESETMLC